MFFGATLTNISRTSFSFFDSLREIDAPLYLIFFVLAGASLNIGLLGKGLMLTSAFIFFRGAGKIIGAFAGAELVKAPTTIKKYMGPALLPQAGIALGCALIAKHTLHNLWGNQILTITIATTVVFELIGPWITKLSLIKAGEIGG